MIGTTTARAATARTPRVLWAAIAVAWAVAIAAQATGNAALVHHDTLEHARLPLWATAGLFVVAWQLMIAAMMLPSSLPMIRTFRVAASARPHPERALAALVGGYALVWSAFGLAAFVGDLGLHRLVHDWAWLEAHQYVIAGSTLLLAGAFQFTDLKDRCLSECRHPGTFLMQHYGRGTAAAFRLGLAHGRFCVGCCWALMLIGFAAGVASLWWMAALTAVMVVEKTARGGERYVRPIGLWLIALGLVVLAFPSWSVFGSA